MKSLLRSLLGGSTSDSSKRAPVTVISGLPRSGTSLMMKMLEAGGIPPLTDQQRTADRDNPRGYYEFERVKKLPEGDVAWLPQAEGKAVKVITALLPHLPPDYTYHILMMERALEEILASQRKMLERRQERSEQSDAEMTALFEAHLQQTRTWLAQQENMRVLNVSYNELLADPGPVLHRIAHFLQGRVDTEKMAAVIDPALYRNRLDE